MPCSDSLNSGPQTVDINKVTAYYGYMARHKLPADIKRQELFGRVNPKTLAFLSSLNAPNMGRAIDIAVGMLDKKEPSPAHESHPQETVAA